MCQAGANVLIYLFRNHDLTAQVQTLRDAIDAKIALFVGGEPRGLHLLGSVEVGIRLPLNLTIGTLIQYLGQKLE